MDAARAETANRAADRAARNSFGRLVALIAMRTGDVAAAEDAVADAFAVALRQWPVDGVPSNPDAWLMTVARRRGIEAFRHRVVAESGVDHLLLLTQELEDENGMPAEIPDRRLALMFACAHPAVDPASRAPLILQAVLGLNAAEIASAFLVSPRAMSQRLVRAKNRIRDTGIPFRIPELEELPERLDAVLNAIYAVFTRGWQYHDAQGEALAEEAIWLAQVVAGLLPDEPEVTGMLALMLFAEARRGARRGPGGQFVPFDEQDTGLWNHAALAQADRLLHAASAAGATGRYQLEAAIQSAHVVRRLTGAATWPAVLALYDHLMLRYPSPVVALNRAMALAEIAGPGAGLAALDALAQEPQLASYQPYWAARGALAARASDFDDARKALTMALGLSDDDAVRNYLRERIDRLA